MMRHLSEGYSAMLWLVVVLQFLAICAVLYWSAELLNRLGPGVLWPLLFAVILAIVISLCGT